MDSNANSLMESLISIASETTRLQKVFDRAISKLTPDEQRKYRSQFSWFQKKVDNALNSAELNIVNPEGQLYDPGMAVTPLNLEEFDTEDQLFIAQTIEPIVLQNGAVVKIGTVILGRTEE